MVWRGSRGVRRRACAWLCAAFALALIAGASPARAATQLGVYAGGGNPAGVAAFGEWLDRPPGFSLEYLPWAVWSDVAEPTWLLDQWEGTPYVLVLSVPMLTSDGATLAEGAAGDYDDHFARLAENLVIRGLGGSVIRPGWEFNYDWFPWYAGADPASFVMYWQRIVNAMRGVDGAAFTFDWSPNLGGSVELETVYPGDDYVDTIGLDVYNHDWHPGWDDPVTRWSNLRSKEYGLDWHRDFAAARDKPVSFAEWGMITRMDGHGGGDDPYFIEQMYSWIEQGNTAFHIYFNFDTALTTSSLTNGWFPDAARRFRDLFGPAPALAPPPPPPPIVPPSPPPPALLESPPPPAPPVQPPQPFAPSAAAAPGVSRPSREASIAGAPGLAPRARVVLRRPARRLRVSVAIRNAPLVRSVDVLIDGRRVCRDRQRPFRCAPRELGLGRHQLVVNARGGGRNVTLLERVVNVRRQGRRPLVLRPSRQMFRDHYRALRPIRSVPRLRKDRGIASGSASGRQHGVACSRSLTTSPICRGDRT